MSNINTIRQRLIDKVQEKYPHITSEQVDDEIKYYFKYVKKQTQLLPKLEITLGIIGRLYVVRSQIERTIKSIQRQLSKPIIAEWRREKLSFKLERMLILQDQCNDIKENGKTYKSIKRKRKDGREPSKH